jgi:G3E family GTPase
MKDSWLEPNNDKHSEASCSRAHSLSRSIECADTIVIADRVVTDPPSLAEAVRLLGALNPKAAILGPELERLDFNSLSAGKKVDLIGDETLAMDSHLKMEWAIADAEFSRVETHGSRPLHLARFLIGAVLCEWPGRIVIAIEASLF